MLRTPIASWCAARLAQPHTAFRGRILAGTFSWSAAASSVVVPYRTLFHTSTPSSLNSDCRASWRLSTTRVHEVGCGLSTLRQLHTTAAALAAPVTPVKGLEAATTTSPRSDAAATSDTSNTKGTPAGGASSSKAGSGDGKSTSPARQATIKGGAVAEKATREAPKGNTTDAPAAAGATSKEEANQKAEKEEESWWRRWWRSFKSEGKDFSLFYLPIYPATFFLLYAGFATGMLQRDKILDVVLNIMGDHVDRKKMYARVEAWNTWANLGFAFVINELIEVIRFPVVVILYYALKPYSTYFAHWVLKVTRRVRRAKVADEAKK